MTQHWRRPVPTVGDTTAASERAAAPDGWAFSPEEIAALDRVIGARRDIRRYRPDPVPEHLVRRVVEAGHAGPSVGHSQPWRFIVIRDEQTRARAAVMADAQRMAQAAAMEPERGQRLLDLQLEGIREAPVAVVVACDRRSPALGTLGRATFTDADLWSCACAVENMWLTSRAHGLGMGWVTLFEPDELAALLHLPEGVETLGWLCLGWPDERPPGPGLERRAWSRKAPLDDVILHERWPADDLAPPEHHLAAPQQVPTSEATMQEQNRGGHPLTLPERERVVGARDGADRLLTPPGSLGILDAALDKVVAVAGAEVARATLLLAAADHPVTELGVSSFERSVTRELLEASVAGQAVGASTARAAGLDVVVVDCGTDGLRVEGALDARATRPRGNLVEADALHPDDVEALLAAGRRIGAETASRSPLVCLGETGIGNTTVAAAMAARLLDLAPEQAVGIGAAADAGMAQRKTEVVRQALARTTARQPAEVLAALGGAELALLTGVTLGVAESGGVVVLDGLATSVAALAAVRLEPAVQARLVAGQCSRERAHALVLQALGLEPLLQLRLRAGEGVGAVLAAQMLLTGLAMRRTAGRVDR